MNDPELKKEQTYLAYKTCDIGGKIGVAASYDDKSEQFLPEQITAALLQKLKATAERGLEGQRVTDCVIGCPQYWTDAQRRSVLDAANIAGLNVLRLMNETTAVALNYGILRPLPEKTQNTVMFVDIGECSTCVSLVSFTQGKLQVLSTASDRNLGGRDFGQLLVDHFAKYVKEKYKMDVLTNPKAMLKLRKECERVKRILSANTKVHFNIEFLMNDTDVKGEIERKEFEAMVKQSMIGRILAVVEKCLEKANVKKEDLFSVEVVGGATRIPCIQTLLTDFFGKEPSKTCDGDESVARGCALQCAMLSPTVKVRDFEILDIASFPIEVQWGPAPQGDKPSDAMDTEMDNTRPVFPLANPIPSVKMISFKEGTSPTSPFQLAVRYSDLSEMPPEMNPLIGRFIVSGMPNDPDKIPPKMKVWLALNVHGIFNVRNAQLLHAVADPVEDAPAEENKEADKDAAAPAADAEMKTEDAKEEEPKKEEEKKEEEKTAEEKTAEAADAKPDMDTSSDEPKKAEATPAEPPKKLKKKVKREELTITSYPTGGLDQKTKSLCFEKEAHMANQDRIIAETNEVRNTLESYVLEMRAKIEDGELKTFINDADRSTFSSSLSAMELWLEDEGYDAQKSEYKKRVDDLKKIGDPVVRRQYESLHREEFAGGLKKEIQRWEKLAASTEEKYSHIEEEERKKVAEECKKVDQWMVQQLSKQNKLSPHENPVLTCEEIRKQQQSLEKICRPIMSKPKPPPPKPKEEEKKQEEKKEEAKGEEKKEEAKTEDKKEETAKPDEPAAEEPAKTTETVEETAAKMEVE